MGRVVIGSASSIGCPKAFLTKSLAVNNRVALEIKDKASNKRSLIRELSTLSVLSTLSELSILSELIALASGHLSYFGLLL
jgi:hypothetical protein